MPYGIPKEKPEQTRWMEKCVDSINKANPDYEESRCIAICKAQLKKQGWKVKKSEEDSEITEFSEQSLRDIENKFYSVLHDGTSYPEVGYPTSTSYYISDIYDDYVIVSKGEKYYRVPYTIGSGENDLPEFDWSKAYEVVRKTSFEKVSEYTRKPAHVRKKMTDGTKTI